MARRSEDHVRRRELRQRGIERRIVQAGDDRQQSVGNSRPIAAAVWATALTGASRSSLANSRVLQRGRDRRQSRPPAQPRSTAVIEQAALLNRLGQLLQEQRHAVGIGDDPVAHAPGHGLAAGMRSTRASFERGRTARPAASSRAGGATRRELRPGRGHEQHRQPLDARRSARSSSSRLLGSIQCTSSSRMTTGRRTARPSSCRSQISCSLALRPCGPSVEGG